MYHIHLYFNALRSTKCELSACWKRTPSTISPRPERAVELRCCYTGSPQASEQGDSQMSSPLLSAPGLLPDKNHLQLTLVRSSTFRQQQQEPPGSEMCIPVLGTAILISTHQSAVTEPSASPDSRVAGPGAAILTALPWFEAWRLHWV